MPTNLEGYRAGRVSFLAIVPLRFTKENGFPEFRAININSHTNMNRIIVITYVGKNSCSV
jgi:hypothetical protein